MAKNIRDHIAVGKHSSKGEHGGNLAVARTKSPSGAQVGWTGSAPGRPPGRDRAALSRGIDLGTSRGRRLLGRALAYALRTAPTAWTCYFLDTNQTFIGSWGRT
jgi:hypothetical protein